MKAARLVKPGKRLEIQDVDDPVPRASQAVVRVEACGVCHTDVDLRRGSIGSIKVEAIGMRFPVTLGHEIAGTVESLGPEANVLRVGEKVLVDWVSGEGSCVYCKRGDEGMCDKVRYLGIHADGGYAHKVLVPHERYLFKIDQLETTQAAPLADAGFSAFAAVRKASISPESSVAIIGLGGLGLMGVQVAARVVGAHVIAVGRREDALDMARSFGAAEALNSSRGDFAKELQRVSGGNGVDAIVDFVCSGQTLKAYPPILAKDGKYVMGGLFGGDLSLHAPLLSLRNQSFIGSNYGNRSLFSEVIDLAKAGKLESVTRSSVRLESINEALDMLDGERAVGRQIIIP